MSRRLPLLVLFSAQFVVMLDTSIVNVAVPSMQHDLGLSHVGVAWVVNAYFLSFGGFLLLAGRLADVIGRRRMFMAGSAVFTAGTLAAGFAGTESVLVAARAFQGLGAAALSPAALSILLVMFSGTGRAKAMSGWGAASTLGGATGVVGGGLLAASLDWSWVFFVTVPVTVAALVLAPRLFGDDGSPGPRRQFDVGGAAAVTGAAMALIYAALSVPEHGPLSVHTIGGLLVAGAALAAFLRFERRVADPLVPLELFRSSRVALGVAAGLLGGAARAATFFIVPVFLQQALVMDPAAAGLAMVPTSIAGFIFSTTALPRVLGALGPQRSVLIGLLLVAGAHLWLAGSGSASGYAIEVLPALLMAAVGTAMSFTPTTMVIASGIPLERSGLASGLSNASSQIGAAVGVAALSAAVGFGVANGSPLEAFHGAFLLDAGLALSAASLAAALLLLDRRQNGRRGCRARLVQPGKPRPLRHPTTQAHTEHRKEEL